MTHTARAVTVAALTLALTGPALAMTAGSAQAAGRDWKTLSAVSGGKVQACKVATTKTGPWKIKLRVDATKATTRVSGTAVVTKNGKTTKARWKSGWITKGHVSSVGTVKLHRGASYQLGAGIGTGGMGNGGSFKASQIRGC